MIRFPVFGFHGTSAKNVYKILDEGFDERLATGNNYFGSGIYFSSGPLKPDTCTGENKALDGPVRNRNIILSWISMGRPLRHGPNVKAFPNDPRYRCRGHPPKQHDSVLAASENDEDTYVVYRGDQVRPYAVITYDLLTDTTQE